VWLIDFDPAVGSEIRKVRPAVVVSLDAIGRLPLRLVVPVTDWKPQYASYRGSPPSPRVLPPGWPRTRARTPSRSSRSPSPGSSAPSGS